MQQFTTGTVKWFDPVKGYGFVLAESGEDLFIHRSALPFGEVLAEGDRIQFDIEESAKGPNAVRVGILTRSGNPPRPRNESFHRASPDVQQTIPSGQSLRGTVTRYDLDRGFGFIHPEQPGPDVFVHRSAVGHDLTVGDQVEFRIGQSPKGPRAEQVRILDAAR